MLNADVSDSAGSDSAVTLSPAALATERHRSSVSRVAQTDALQDGVATPQPSGDTSIAPRPQPLTASEELDCNLPAAITVATATYDPGQCETFLLLWAETDSLLASLETSAPDAPDRP